MTCEENTLSLIIEMKTFWGTIKVVNTRYDCRDDKIGDEFAIQHNYINVIVGQYRSYRRDDKIGCENKSNQYQV